MARRIPRTPPFIADTTTSRRTVLEWLGKGAVFALGAPLIEACADLDAHAATADDVLPPDGPGDAAEADADFAEVSAADADAVDAPADAGEFPFRPGDGSLDVFGDWNVRTVDAHDLADILATWRLTIDGLVDNPLTLDFPELIALARQDQVTDFHCVEGWSVYDVPWNGVSFATLFDRVRPRPEATYVAFHTIGEAYNESLPIAVAREPRTILGYGVGGSTLPLPHGFPLRVVVPRLLGYKNAKYVQRIELTDRPLLGYWVRAGYPYAGEVPASRLRPGKY